MKTKILRSIFSISALLVIFSVFTVGYIMNMKKEISDNVLRLHIVAASNSEPDQNLKLAVRNRILNDFSADFSKCSSIVDSLDYVSQNIDKIKEASADELKSRGCTLPVEAELKQHSFPTKTYGDISLPSGKYTTLDIKIGNAEGQNWWCVMYPPLCINDSIAELPTASKEKLMQSLSDDEYTLITSSNCSDVNIKFRLAEILGDIFK